MKTTDAKLETIDRDLRDIARLIMQMQTSDFDTVDYILRTIRDMRADVEEIRLEVAPEATEDLSEPIAA